MFFKDREDYKKQLEHDIEWNDSLIESMKRILKREEEWLERTPEAKNNQSLRAGIRNSYDAINKQRKFSADWQKLYVELTGNRYGHHKLKVIRGRTI